MCSGDHWVPLLGGALMLSFGVLTTVWPAILKVTSDPFSGLGIGPLRRAPLSLRFARLIGVGFMFIGILIVGVSLAGFFLPNVPCVYKPH